LESQASHTRYELNALLGSGGFAGVWRSTVDGEEEERAVKVFERSGVNVADERSVLREADLLRVASMCLGPHLAPQFREAGHGSILGHKDGYFFLSMDLLRGHSVQQFLNAWHNQRPKVSERVLRACLGDGSAALCRLHEHGIIHRDVKCENMMVTAEARCMLLDFGVSIAVEGTQAAADLDATLQHEIAVLGQPLGRTGTARFMAPEIARRDFKGRAKYDYKVDVWSLGVTMYEFIVGRSPLEEQTLFPGDIKHCPLDQIFCLIMSMPAPQIPQEMAEAKTLRKAVERCLVKDPADRISSEELCILDFVQPFPDDREAIRDCFRGVCPEF